MAKRKNDPRVKRAARERAALARAEADKLVWNVALQRMWPAGRTKSVALDGCVVNVAMPGAWSVNCTLSKARNLSRATYGNGARALGSKVVYEDFGSELIRRV